MARDAKDERLAPGMRVFLSSRVPRLTILGATMQEIEERPAPEAGCNISSFNRKSFSSQLRSKKGDEFLLNAIEGEGVITKIVPLLQHF